MTRLLLLVTTLLAISVFPEPRLDAQPSPPTRTITFDEALRRFSVDHDRRTLRVACLRSIATEPTSDMARFYIGLLDETDEDWSAAERDFEAFLAITSNQELAEKARGELQKLPVLIREDKTVTGKQNRQYRQHLGYADLLQRAGFSREALLEASAAKRILPERWEAYAIASAILLSQHQLEEARHFLEQATRYAPENAREKLKQLARAIEAFSSTANKSR